MWRLFWPSVGFIVATLAALAVRWALLTMARRWARPNGPVAALGEAVRVPSLVWCLVLGLYVAIAVASELERLPRRLSEELAVLLEVSVIISLTITIAGVVGTLVARAGESKALGGAVTGLARTTARVVVFVVGFLVLLGELGIHITPLLTALGVGGLAVALALQDSLANLFAGIHLLADRPIRVGDYVKLAEGVEGFVTDIGWRSTRLRTLANNSVVIPNKKVAESIVTNYNMPEAFTGVSVKVTVDYGVDPDRVEHILAEEARRAAGEVPGMRSEPAPVVWLIPGFGELGLEFTVACQVTTIGDRALVEHELRKRILRRLHAEGISVPIRARLVELREPGALSDDSEQRHRADHRQG